MTRPTTASHNDPGTGINHLCHTALRRQGRFTEKSSFFGLKFTHLPKWRFPATRNDRHDGPGQESPNRDPLSLAALALGNASIIANRQTTTHQKTIFTCVPKTKQATVSILKNAHTTSD